MRRYTSSVSALLLNRSFYLNTFLFGVIILIANILKLAAERPLKDIRDEYNYPKKKGIKIGRASCRKRVEKKYSKASTEDEHIMDKDHTATTQMKRIRTQNRS